MAIIKGKGSVSYLTKMPEGFLSGSLRPSGHLGILDALTLPMTLINHQYTYEWVNSCYASAHGKEPSDIIGKTVPGVWGWSTFNEYIKRNLDQCLQGQEVRQEVWIDFPALGRRYCETVYSPYNPDDTGSCWAIVVTFDMTERKRIESQLKAYQEHFERLVEERSTELTRTNEELRVSEEKYRNIFENAVEGIFQTTLDGGILSANPALARMFGCESPEELIRSVSDIGTEIYVNPDRRRELMAILEQKGVAHNFEFEAKRQDGALKWASLNVRAIKDPQGRILYLEGTMEDITDRKEMEKALLESEERYRIAIEHSNDGVVITRGNEHLYVNRRYVEMFGYESAEELIGKPLSATVHFDDIDRVTDISCRRMRGEPAPLTYEFKGRRKDGGTLYAEVSVARIMFQGKPASLAYMRDITQRRQAEEAMLRIRREYEQLGIARTKVIDRLAHEMRTPIAVIQGNLTLLKKRLGNHAPCSNMDSLERNVERLSRVAWDAQRTFDACRFVEAIELHEEIGWFANRMELIEEIPSHVRVQLNTLREWISQYLAQSEGSTHARKIYPEIRHIISNVKHQAMRELSFYHKGDDELQIAIDKVVLNEIMDALLKNAVENTPDGGVISVLFERNNGGAEIHVADTGIGITRENQKYLFSGFLFARESDFYSSGKPFMFGAGGKGLDLLRIRLYGRRYGFHISVKSRRCPHLPQDRDRCSGSVKLCHHCSRPEDCLETGGTTFSLIFPDVSGDTRSVV
jgi:PAS domain S-box-containing protein